MIALIPPELVAAGVALILLGGLIFALTRSAGSRAKADTERDALAEADRLRREAERAEAEARRKNEGLR